MTNPKITIPTAEQKRQYRASGFWQDQTIYQIVRGHAERAPSRFAVRDRYRRLTYRQLVAAAERLAAHLSENGIEPGQQVAVWLPNRLETVVTLLACSKNRYICCPSLHRNHTVMEVLELLERFRPALLITETGYGAGSDQHEIETELARLSVPPKHHGLQPLTRDNADTPVFSGLNGISTVSRRTEPPDPDTVVYLALTSGTTAEPKGVMHSDNTLLANARAIAADWRFNEASVIYTLSPLSHNLGFGAMVTALYAGGEIVLSRLNPGETLVDDLIRTGATFIYGVPAHAVDLLKELKQFREQGAGEHHGVSDFRRPGTRQCRRGIAGIRHHPADRVWDDGSAFP